MKMDLNMFSCNLVFTLLLYFISHDFIKLSHAFRTFTHANGNKLTLAKINETISIKCDGEPPMIYCSIYDPQGYKIQSIHDNLQEGYCAVEIKLNMSHFGEWACDTARQSHNVVRRRLYTVRNVDNFAAVDKTVSQTLGSLLTLHWVPVIDLAIKNCLFVTPSGISFITGNWITYNNAVMDMYYFNSGNKSIRSDDCSVTIKNLEEEHIGQWTCKASIMNGTEYTDTIDVIEIEPEPEWRIDGYIPSPDSQWTLWKHFRWSGFVFSYSFLMIMVAIYSYIHIVTSIHSKPTGGFWSICYRQLYYYCTPLYYLSNSWYYLKRFIVRIITWFSWNGSTVQI